MKHLFEDWKEIQGRIQRAKYLFLFMDYDGTLTPIVDRPDLAFCPSAVKRHLDKLRDLPGVSIAIISGRSLEDVREKVGVSGITYVGNHGLDIENPAGRHKRLLTSARRTELKKMTRHWQDSLKEIPGILLEEKGSTLSVHYRHVPQKWFTKVRQVLEAELQQWGDRWEIAHGKMVLEIRPKMDFSKGEATRQILKSFPSRDLLPIYLGDDQTDEDAFRVVKGRGVSVYVGPGSVPSEADFFLQDPSEVQEFLFRCREARHDGRHCVGAD